MYPSSSNKTLLLAALILFSTVSYAQKLEGMIHYVRTMNYIKQLTAVDYLSKQLIDKYSYVYGNRLESKSYARLYFNATQTKFEDSDENDMGYSYKKAEYTITRDFSNNTLHDYMDVLGKTYIVEDSLKAPRWIILNEMKEIAGHACMNASYNDTLKKQKVIGWYALDMPISGGPERFFGLPGMLLGIDINNGALVLEADKIDLKPLTTELDFPKKAKGKKIKEKDYIGILRKQIVENRKQEQPVFSGLRY
jgi:GLPGLI family protein